MFLNWGADCGVTFRLAREGGWVIRDGEVRRVYVCVWGNLEFDVERRRRSGDESALGSGIL